MSDLASYYQRPGFISVALEGGEFFVLCRQSSNRHLDLKIFADSVLLLDRSPC